MNTRQLKPTGVGSTSDVMTDKPNIAIVGLGFGAEFIPIYQRHPEANMAAICQRTESSLNEIGDKYGVEKRYTDYAELLSDPDIDAIHLNSPIPNHAEQTIAALEAGKHVACTVPMATSVEDCQKIVELCASKGLKYMMMETVVYAREFLFMKELYDKGELGKLQFLKATDLQPWLMQVVTRLVVSCNCLAITCHPELR